MNANEIAFGIEFECTLNLTPRIRPTRAVGGTGTLSLQTTDPISPTAQRHASGGKFGTAVGLFSASFFVFILAMGVICFQAGVKWQVDLTGLPRSWLLSLLRLTTTTAQSILVTDS